MTDSTSQPDPVDPGHDPGVDPPPDDDRDPVTRAEAIDESEEDVVPLPEPDDPDDPDVTPRPKDVALEASDVTMPGDPNFDESNEPLTGADADPPPGATAG